MEHKILCLESREVADIYQEATIQVLSGFIAFFIVVGFLTFLFYAIGLIFINYKIGEHNHDLDETDR